MSELERYGKAQRNIRELLHHYETHGDLAGIQVCVKVEKLEEDAKALEAKNALLEERIKELEAKLEQATSLLIVNESIDALNESVDSALAAQEQPSDWVSVDVNPTKKGLYNLCNIKDLRGMDVVKWCDIRCCFLDTYYSEKMDMDDTTHWQPITAPQDKGANDG